MYNDSDTPCELISLDYDKVLSQEEDLLKTTEGFENDALLLAPREPGETMAQRLQKRAALLLLDQAPQEQPQELK